MKMVNLTINGKKVSVPAGTTVLKAAEEAGIEIPTLCYHPALTSIGACRMCLVEIEGQRNLQAACVFPVDEGMIIQTESPRVVRARIFVLDMLFAQRNHFCMYCETSGDCELQNLGYRYGIDHFAYETYVNPFPVDATPFYFLMEHNRCILCQRCIRACGELSANHTLGLQHRGTGSMIHADADIPFGESSCISCGTCLQVCPTGAIIDKRSAFKGRENQTEHIKSTCSQCSIGCGIEIITRGGNVLRITGDWDSVVNGGLLCRRGRFDPLYDKRQRITAPLLRRKGTLAFVSWDEALQAVARRLGAVAPDKIGLLVSTDAANEALFPLSKLFQRDLGVSNIGLLNDVAPRPFTGPSGILDDINKSDLILVIGADIVKDQPVASFLVKRRVDKGIRLIVVDDKDNGLASFACMNIGTKAIDKAVQIAGRAEYPVVLYGAGITPEVISALEKIQQKASFVAIEPGVNTHGAAKAGLAGSFNPSEVRFLYAVLGEQPWEGFDILENIAKNAFIVVQAGFVSDLTERANVVLPTAIWPERSGTLTNTEGRIRKLEKALEPKGKVRQDWEAVSLLANKLGRKLEPSCDESSIHTTPKLN